jgi:hypothetical protein
MIKTVEAVFDERGQVSLLEPVQLPAGRRALLMILEEEPALHVPETALFSEPALAEDWPGQRKTLRGHICDKAL